MRHRMIKIGAIVVCLVMLASLSLATPSLAGPPVDGHPDHNSVSNYSINWAVETGPGTIAVEGQARYCSACNPGNAGTPGCAPFTHPGGYYGATHVDGTYIAIRVKDSGGTVLGMQKLVLHPGNMTLSTTCTWQFIFGGLAMSR